MAHRHGHGTGMAGHPAQANTQPGCATNSGGDGDRKARNFPYRPLLDVLPISSSRAYIPASRSADKRRRGEVRAREGGASAPYLSEILAGSPILATIAVSNTVIRLSIDQTSSDSWRSERGRLRHSDTVALKRMGDSKAKVLTPRRGNQLNAHRQRPRKDRHRCNGKTDA